jgi:hypothetical protein
VLPISGFMNLVHKTRNHSQSLLPAAHCPQRPAFHLSDFAADQEFLSQADADSLCFGSHNLPDLVNGCGTKCAWSLNSMTRRTGSTTGSRFALDNRELVNNPITGRGLRLQTVNLKRTPNIELFCCHLKCFPAHRMPVCLHWLGLERVRDTNCFTCNEVAVVNMALNVTHPNIVLKDSERDEPMTDQLSKLKLFETTVPGPSSKSLTGHSCKLSSDSMLEFGQEFMEALEILSNDSLEFDSCFTKHIAGMDFSEMQLLLCRIPGWLQGCIS